MTRFRKLLLVTAGAVTLCGVQACSAGSELNPQPLPPQDPTHAPNDPSQKGSDSTSSGSSGASATPGGAADAGAESGDASDSGDH